MPLTYFGRLWNLARRVEWLFELEAKHGEALEKMVTRLIVLEERLTRLERARRGAVGSRLPGPSVDPCHA